MEWMMMIMFFLIFFWRLPMDKGLRLPPLLFFFGDPVECMMIMMIHNG